MKKDITINKNYLDESDWACFATIKGVLDGQGHTITFENSDALCNGVAESGIVQNIGFKGSLKATNSSGPLGLSVSGSVINCWSENFRKRSQWFCQES